MSDTGERGKFSTNISQDVIEEALRAVRRHTGEEPAEVAPEQASAEAAAAKVEAQTEVEIETAGPSDAAKDHELEQLKAQLEFSQAKGRELMEKVRSSHEAAMRSAADLENFKKRASKEKDEVLKYGLERLLKDLFPVVDNLDRAVEHAKSSSDFDSFKQGVAMTRKLFDDTLARHGVKSFTSVGALFDPRVHEAMQQVESTEVPPNHVAAELLRGFTLNDRLVRPALVMVSRAPEVTPSSPDKSEGT